MYLNPAKKLNVSKLYEDSSSSSFPFLNNSLVKLLSKAEKNVSVPGVGMQSRMLEYMQDDKDIYIGVRVKLGFLTQELIARGGCLCIGSNVGSQISSRTKIESTLESILLQSFEAEVGLRKVSTLGAALCVDSEPKKSKDGIYSQISPVQHV